MLLQYSHSNGRVISIIEVWGIVFGITLSGALIFLLLKLNGWKVEREFSGLKRKPLAFVHNKIQENPLAEWILIVRLISPIRGTDQLTVGTTIRCFGDETFRNLESSILGPIVAINGDVVAIEFSGRDFGGGAVVPESMPNYIWGMRKDNKLYLTTEVRFLDGGRTSFKWRILKWNALVREVKLKRKEAADE